MVGFYLEQEAKCAAEEDSLVVGNRFGSRFVRDAALLVYGRELLLQQHLQQPLADALYRRLFRFACHTSVE